MSTSPRTSAPESSSQRADSEPSTAAARPPSVDKLARSIAHVGLPHPLCVEIARLAISSNQVDAISSLAIARKRQMLTPVINATGVLLHTNLGRSPVAYSTPATASNLELSLGDGKRGSRQKAIGDLLASATGAEAAMVVNNCAGAVLLVLAALANGKGAVVSRGELVEIGGGFRVPDVMAQSGANLIEVGTTNRTRLADYERAVADNDVALVMQIHQSNYKIIGFTEAASLAELATLDVPVVADIGSGLLDAACPWLDGPPPPWLANEPAVKQSLDAGAALVLFSGDKLFGGPQAGIIVGKAELVAACGRHPLARALRPGGLVLSALQETTLAYLNRAGQQIPFWQMATQTIPDLTDRAANIKTQFDSAQTAASQLPEEQSKIFSVKVIDTEAVPGGGTLPEVTMPSIGLEIQGSHVDALRGLDRPIIARVTANKTTVLDLRTIDLADDNAVLDALCHVLIPATSFLPSADQPATALIPPTSEGAAPGQPRVGSTAPRSGESA